MKWYQTVLVFVYSLAALYFLYMAGMHLFVYFMNKSLGHSESFRLPAIYLVSAALFLIVLGFYWYATRQGQSMRLANFMLLVPFLLALVYALWAILLVFSSGGKWN